MRGSAQRVCIEWEKGQGQNPKEYLKFKLKRRNKVFQIVKYCFAGTTTTKSFEKEGAVSGDKCCQIIAKETRTRVT